MTPRLVITAGEPAGIGPDIVVMAAQRSWPAQLVCVADQSLLTQRAAALGLDLQIDPFSITDPVKPHQPGHLKVIHIPLREPAIAGMLNTSNASYVLATLTQAADLCLSNDAHAMVTAPVQKSVINDAGIPFSGHTEFFQRHCDAEHVVMLLAAGDLRVALATTHLPLTQVSSAITGQSLHRVLRILRSDLRTKFGISEPRITVLGLNPHAGEGGHLGREEIDIISPALDELRTEGFQLNGPLPADTAFNPDTRAQTDAYLAMYHDQGLPVLKYAGFGEAVNITLGLPIIRTSVDHGTALSLAASGEASASSLHAAINLAISCSQAASI